MGGSPPKWRRFRGGTRCFNSFLFLIVRGSALAPARLPSKSAPPPNLSPKCTSRRIREFFVGYPLLYTRGPLSGDYSMAIFDIMFSWCGRSSLKRKYEGVPADHPANCPADTVARHDCLPEVSSIEHIAHTLSGSTGFCLYLLYW